MPKTRNEAAQEVRDAFIPAETATEVAAARTARCLATLMEARMKAKLKPMVGAEVIERITRATTRMSEARADFMAAHELLAEIRFELGITTGYGEDDCPPNTGAARPGLAAVA